MNKIPSPRESTRFVPLLRHGATALGYNPPLDYDTTVAASKFTITQRVISGFHQTVHKNCAL